MALQHGGPPERCEDSFYSNENTITNTTYHFLSIDPRKFLEILHTGPFTANTQYDNLSL